MRVAIVGKLRKIEPFSLSPFPFRDGGTKSEKSIIKTNCNRKRAKNPIFEDLAHIFAYPSPERGGSTGDGVFSL